MRSWFEHRELNVGYTCTDVFEVSHLSIPRKTRRRMPKCLPNFHALFSRVALSTLSIDTVLLVLRLVFHRPLLSMVIACCGWHAPPGKTGFAWTGSTLFAHIEPNYRPSHGNSCHGLRSHCFVEQWKSPTSASLFDKICLQTRLLSQHHWSGNLQGDGLACLGWRNGRSKGEGGSESAGKERW